MKIEPFHHQAPGPLEMQFGWSPAFDITPPKPDERVQTREARTNAIEVTETDRHFCSQSLAANRQ